MGHGDALRGREGVRVFASGLQRGQAAWGLEGLNGINWSDWGGGRWRTFEREFSAQGSGPTQGWWGSLMQDLPGAENTGEWVKCLHSSKCVGHGSDSCQDPCRSQPSPKEADDLGLQRERAPPCSEQMFSLPRPPSVFGMKDSWSVFSE